jgi:ATP-dependent DNA helicase RecQ
MELLNEPVKKPKKSKKTKIIEDSKPVEIIDEIAVKTEDELLLEEYNVILKKYFGYDTLKKEQFEAIKNILVHKKDVLFIHQTSYGKSILYQMAFLLSQDKNVFVITPLISLSEDQKRHMEDLNISVCIFNSTNKNKNNDLNSLLTEPKLCYITPEWLTNEKNLNFLSILYENNLISLFAIDESHLISMGGWGDFRSSYERLDCIRNEFFDVPILALSATASIEDRKEIIDKLKLKNCALFVGDFNRPNLYYEIKQKTKSTILDEIENLIIKYQKKDNKTIIYCKTKKNTEEVSEKLNQKNIPCEFYHAELTDETRKNIYEKFLNGVIHVIACTISFAQGLNIPKVSLIIHYSPPKSIMNYVQEVGRAGRTADMESYCFMFYENSDITIHKKQNQEIRDPVRKKYLSNEIQKMEQYIHTKECRRKLLLSHFGQYYEGNCNNCDNCCKEAKELTNYTVPSYIILSVLSRMQDCGATIIINILRGSKNKYIKEEFTRYPEYGKLKHFSEAYLKNVFQELHNNAFLSTVPNPKHSFATKIIINKTGNVWIRNMKEAYPTYEILIKADNIENQLLW